MKKVLSDLIKDKRVLLLGFGKEGQATYKLLGEIGGYSRLDIADMKHIDGVDEKTAVFSGENYMSVIDDYDVAFKSPGIVLPKERAEYRCMITSQTEIFLQVYGRQTIGITGTKGKSTVSSLLYHVLHENNVPCFLVGNIGKPVFEIADMIERDTTIVFEISCHQLEWCKYSPSLAVLLNIYEDHLDHYGTRENYAKAKKNIYLNQYPLDTLYCTEEFKPSRDEAKARIIVADKEILPFKSFNDINGVKLRGTHNMVNCSFVYNIAKSYGITDEQFITSLKSFAPLRHRLELIGSKDGIDYFDDSISTTVESTISAIESIDNAYTVLIGGMDRGIDYTKLVDYLLQNNGLNIILMYQSGKRILEMLNNAGYSGKVSYCDDLHAALHSAQQTTPAGGACILSPAAASYGYFKNFEERGDVFKSIVFGNN